MAALRASRAALALSVAHGSPLDALMAISVAETLSCVQMHRLCHIGAKLALLLPFIALLPSYGVVLWSLMPDWTAYKQEYMIAELLLTICLLTALTM